MVAEPAKRKPAAKADAAIRLMLVAAAVAIVVTPRPLAAATPPDAAVRPAAKSVFEAIEAAVAFYWIVDAPPGGATCQHWTVERGARRLSDDRYAIHLVQDLPQGSSRRPVRLYVGHDGRTVQVLDPRVRLEHPPVLPTDASLGGCRRDRGGTFCDGFTDVESWTPTSGADRIKMTNGPTWFLSEASCRETLRTGPHGPKTCAPVLSRHPEGVDVSPLPEAVRRIFVHGGRIFHVSPARGGATACNGWQVRPTRSGRGEMHAEERMHLPCGDLVYDKTIPFQLWENAITLSGPALKERRAPPPCKKGGGYGLGTIGCGETLLIRGVGATGVSVGGEDWFIDRASCERAMVARPASGE